MKKDKRQKNIITVEQFRKRREHLKKVREKLKANVEKNKKMLDLLVGEEPEFKQDDDEYN